MGLKEDIPSIGKEKLKEMLVNIDTYRSKMKIASDILKNEPGNVKEQLLFHVEYLAKHGEDDYLVNHVIKQQSMFEIYCVDLIMLMCGMIIIIAGVVFYVMRKLISTLIRSKMKKE